jgi:hypothetical protein
MNPALPAEKHAPPLGDDTIITPRKDAPEQDASSAPSGIQIELLPSLRRALASMIGNGPFQSGLFGEGQAADEHRA